MEIDIKQQEVSIGDKYQIYINGQKAYTASVKLLPLLDEIHLFELNGDTPKFIIEKKWMFFKAAYDLTRQNENVFQFRTKQFWKGHYDCQAGADLYDIYAHKGRKYSVFKNDIQIAWWDKHAVSYFKGDNYKMVVDNDSDYELIISFCLIIDNAFSNSEGNSMMRIDFGNILQARAFDPVWRPKK